MDDQFEEIELNKRLFKDVLLFAQDGSGVRLRRYQEQVAEAICDSVIKHQGRSFVVIFPRQSGKNELQAQIETYLLALFQVLPAEMVKVSPTWKPQSLNAMRRLERVLKRNSITLDKWTKESGYIYRVGEARIFFLSGGPVTNVVGATANVLLECDEAQDVTPAKWDKDFAPMAASTNATRVFWGTMWTSTTLLARELRAARAAQEQDGIQRVWLMSADDVAREVPAYGVFVAEQVAKLGRGHPMVRSQYYSEEIDAEGGMFSARRLALMAGQHARQHEPTAGKLYALLVDVAGEDEGKDEGGRRKDEFRDSDALANPSRDATALTVVEVDLGEQETLRAPVYRVVERVTWVGIKHSTLYGQLRSLAEAWRAKYVVIDATGVGAGLASFLDKALPGRVIPFVFNAATKSKLGWRFLSVVETGRYKDWKDNLTPNPFPKREGAYCEQGEQGEFLRQCRACQMEILPGPERRLKWGVPDGMRDPATGDLLHDDLVLSAALCAVLDEQEWVVTGAPVVVRRGDPIAEMDREGF